MKIFRSSKKKMIKPNIEKLEAKKDANGLIQLLKSGEVTHRINAALALGKLKRTRAVPPLVEALKDEDEDVRWAAAWALGEIGKPAARPLIQALNDADSDVRWKAAWSLEKIGKAVVESLIEALKTERGEAKAKVALVLGSVGDARAVRPLVQALGDEDDNVRWAAAWALEKLGDMATRHLIKSLSDGDVEVRREAALALGVTRDEAALVPLLDAMKDEDREVRREAAASIISMGSSKPIPTLQKFLQEEEEEVARLAAAVLGKLGWSPPESEKARFYLINREWEKLSALDVSRVPELLRALSNEGWETKSRASALFREKEEWMRALGNALDHEDEDIRREASLVFKEIADRSVLDTLIRAMGNRDWFVRRSVALALGEIHDERSVGALIESLGDEDDDVRRAAAWALGKLGDIAVPPLLAVLREGETQERRGAAWALGAIGDPAAVEDLVEALRDPDDEVRRGAAWALSEMGEAAVPHLSRAMEEPDLREIAGEILEKVGARKAELMEEVVEEVIEEMAEEAPLLTPAEIEELVFEASMPSSEEGLVEVTPSPVAEEMEREPLSAAGKGDRAEKYIREGRWEMLPELGENAVGALVRALKDADAGIRAKAAWALGVIGSPRAVEALVNSLADDERDVRVKVSDALKKVGHASVDALIGALNKGGDELRREAARVLGEIRDLRSIPSLAKALKDRDERVRGRAADALQKIGEPAVETLQSLLQDEDSTTRAIAASVLTRLGWKPEELVANTELEMVGVQQVDEREARRLISEGEWEQVATLGEAAVPSLLGSLEDPDPVVRKGAAWALGVIRDSRATEALTPLLGDGDVSVRQGAAWALGAIGDARATEALMRSLDDEHAEVRRKAAWALGEIGDRRALERLEAALRDEDADVRRVALLVLEKMGWKPPEEKEMRELIAERQWDRLAGLGDMAVDSLIEALKGGDGETRMKAAWALGEIGDERAVDSLMAALSDSEAKVREKAAWALGKVGAKQAVDALVKALKDEDKGVQEAAAVALEELGWLPALEEMEIGEELLVEVVEEKEEVVSAEPLPAEVADVVPGREAEESPFLEEVTAEEIVSKEISAAPEAEAPVAGEEVRVPAAEEELFEEIVSEEISAAPEAEAPVAGEEVRVPAAEEEVVEEVVAAEAPPEEAVVAEKVEATAEEAPVVPEEIVARPEEAPALLEEATVGVTGKLVTPRSVVEERPVTLQEMVGEAEKLIAGRRWTEVAALGEAAVLPLIKALRSEDRSVRRKAAWLLKEIGDPAVAPLCELRKDRDEEIRALAEEVLKRMGWETGEETELARRLIREGRWEELASLGKPAVQPLIRALSDPDVEKRRKAASLLGVIGDRRAVEPLCSSLRDEDVEVRSKAARSLGRIGDAGAVEGLVSSLLDGSVEVRSRAAEALDKMGWRPTSPGESTGYFVATRQWNKIAELGEEAEQTLRGLLSHADREVREEAGWILEQIESARELESLLKDTGQEAG